MSRLREENHEITCIIASTIVNSKKCMLHSMEKYYAPGYGVNVIWIESLSSLVSSLRVATKYSR